MGNKVVYPVHYTGNDSRLTVSVGGKGVPMDEFVRRHIPIQVTGLTHLNPETKAQNYIGLIIAEELPEENWITF